MIRMRKNKNDINYIFLGFPEKAIYSSPFPLLLILKGYVQKSIVLLKFPPIVLSKNFLKFQKYFIQILFHGSFCGTEAP